MDEYTVGDAARIAHVSVRTLHHYDEIGLLTPSGRSAAGYRLYSEADLRRLKQVLFYRELDFGLDEIARILADPDAGGGDHLRRQHRLLRARQARTAALLRAIEHELEAQRMGLSLTPEEQFEIFGTDRLAEHQAEAERRWGDTDAWRESQRRAATYTKEDWVAIKREADDNVAQFRAALEAGEPPTSDAATEAAEAHRLHISNWFYACGYQLHRNLADLYLSDPRYAETWDASTAPGLARYVHDAIHANADRHQTDSD